MAVLKFVLAFSLALGVPAAAAEAFDAAPPGEPQAIAAIVARAIEELRVHTPTDAPFVRRDAHAKAHGCAKAIFHVDADLPSDLRVGLASKPGASFKAWARFSNGALEPGPDTRIDGRGMALKILDAAPDAASAGSVTAHDVLMINYPVFFSSDVADFTDFMAAGALSGDQAGLKRYAFPSLNPFGWRLRQAWLAYQIASQKIDSPLGARYYSATPYAFGEGRAVKYSARPCAGETSPPAPAEPRAADYLRVALQNGLMAAPACFEFLVQERKGAAMPIDDATVTWDEARSPYRRLATIELPRQDIARPGLDALCENMAFSPAAAPPESRPLGGINRVRAAVYAAISAYRHERNREPIPDAAAAWDRF